MRLSNLADTVARNVEDAAAQISGAFDPVIRLGVTGISGAGKTVFVTSLVSNLLQSGRMHQFSPVASGAVRSVILQPQPDDTLPRFQYEKHLRALTDDPPHWPQSTRSVSQLRLSFRVQPTGLIGGLTGPKTVHLDIVDYPGEWLLDLVLMDKSFDQWSEQTIKAAEQGAQRELSKTWLGLLKNADPDADFDELQAQEMATAFASYLCDLNKAGFSMTTPGRFLLPGDLAGSPVLTFAPMMPGKDRARRGSLGHEMNRRFEVYKSKVVRPFFRDHFASIDRQIVLMDVLGAISAGPEVMSDLRMSMAELLRAFRPGKNSWLSFLLGKKIDRILFAATKADHLHHHQHENLSQILMALLNDAKTRAEFAGAEAETLSIAALRTTVEEQITHKGQLLDAVRGVVEPGGKQAAFYAGELPNDPRLILNALEGDARDWGMGNYQSTRFYPPTGVRKPDEGLAHIRLDRAIEFLVGDKIA